MIRNVVAFTSIQLFERLNCRQRTSRSSSAFLCIGYLCVSTKASQWQRLSCLDDINVYVLKIVYLATLSVVLSDVSYITHICGRTFSYMKLAPQCNLWSGEPFIEIYNRPHAMPPTRPRGVRGLRNQHQGTPKDAGLPACLHAYARRGGVIKASAVISVNFPRPGLAAEPDLSLGRGGRLFRGDAAMPARLVRGAKGV